MFAYLDPASGSAMISVAAAGLAGVGVAVSAGMGKFKGRFKKGGASNEPVETDEEETTEVADADTSDA